MLPCGMLFSGGIENHPRGRGIKIAVRKSVRIGFCELAIRQRPKHGNLPDNLCRCTTCTRQPACDCTAPPRCSRRCRSRRGPTCGGARVYSLLERLQGGARRMVVCRRLQPNKGVLLVLLRPLLIFAVGGADACSRFVCGSRVGRRIRPACSPCGSEPFVVGGIPSFPPQPLPRTRFFIFFAAQYFSRAYPLPFFRRSAHLFFHVSSGQPVVCLFWCCGISAPAV